MESGIYRIRNIVNEKIYIGQSINVKNRLKHHLKELQSGSHVNYFLQRDFDKYKEESFIFEKIHECEEEFLNVMEKYFIEKYNTTHNGYNIKNGNSALSSKHKKQFEKEKLIEKFNSVSFIDIEIENVKLQSFKAMKDIEYEMTDICWINPNYKIIDADQQAIDSMLQILYKRTYEVEKKVYDKVKEIMQEYSDVIYYEEGTDPFILYWKENKDEYFVEVEYKNLLKKLPYYESKEIRINLIGK